MEFEAWVPMVGIGIMAGNICKYRDTKEVNHLGRVQQCQQLQGA
jgi:hypothetical protein